MCFIQRKYIKIVPLNVKCELNKKNTFRQAVKGQGLVSGMLHAMLLKTYADIARELGVAPGGEFRRAYQEV